MIHDDSEMINEVEDDDTMGPVFRALSAHLKEEHNKRVAKTPDRIEYAIQQFEKNDIEYVLKNPAIGHFHCRRKRDDKLFQFWAGTGKPV